MFKKNNKTNILSIKRINFILFFLMFLTILCNFYLTKYQFNTYLLLLNIFIITLFIVFNFLYIKENEKIKILIKDILKNNKNSLIKDRNIYKENKENNTLFNNIMLEKNLIEKDYNDLENFLYRFTGEFFLKEISQKGRDRVELGTSIQKNIHVMFLDIIGFTTLTEKIKPEKALLLLNIYFDGIVEIIKKYNGYIDKFLGDGILIIFADKNANNAINASMEIQKFISNFRISEIGKKIYVGIGINSGNVIMGTIGSKARMEVTIIGDTVNTASRIEGLTRKFKEKIIFSQETYNLIDNKKDFNIKYLGEKVLKGKKIKKRIYGI